MRRLWMLCPLLLLCVACTLGSAALPTHTPAAGGQARGAGANGNSGNTGTDDLAPYHPENADAGIHTPRPRTGTVPRPSGAPAAGKSGPASLYPNPALTPGDLLPGVTGAQTCVSGYAKGVRNVTAEEKAAVYQRYGIPNVSGQHEVDHFIPLTLGGSNALTNLWPQPYEPAPAAHEKDQVELYLHEQVCGGMMSLAEAQNAIRSDWYAVYMRIEKP